MKQEKRGKHVFSTLSQPPFFISEKSYAIWFPRQQAKKRDREPFSVDCPTMVNQTLTEARDISDFALCSDHDFNGAGLQNRTRLPWPEFLRRLTPSTGICIVFRAVPFPCPSGINRGGALREWAILAATTRDAEYDAHTQELGCDRSSCRGVRSGRKRLARRTTRAPISLNCVRPFVYSWGPTMPTPTLFGAMPGATAAKLKRPSPTMTGLSSSSPTMPSPTTIGAL